MRKALAAVLLALILTGCGRRETPAETVRPPQTAPTQVRTEPQTQPATQPPEDGDFVRVLDWIPEMGQELKYAGTDNFTGRQIYPFYEGYLRYGTVKKLMDVMDGLAERGLRLKLWDGYRPVSAQWRLWEVCPDPTYVADPERGHSSHSRGNTVDVTLTDSQGNELEMPTGFDDFTPRADRDYADCTAAQEANARLLEEIMEENGFAGYFGEWWHFTDTDDYPVEEAFQPPLG